MDIFFEQYFDLDIMRDNFGYVLDGFWLTLQIALVAGALSLVWGLVLALLRAAPGRPMMPVRAAAIAYIDIFRGIPLLLVILLIDGSLPVLDVFPQSIRSPDFLGKPEIFWYGVMAITLTYGAYYAEVYRAGLDAVPYGQMEAARSLGMSHARAMRHVIVPQAIRKVIPPMLNDFIALTKDTSLVGVIALVEVVKAGREIQAETFNSSALTLGALLFIIVTIPLARLVDRLIAHQQLAMRRAAP
ncbi:MAG: amino acid ABC transporter permease [Solirubrobacterales bacterium]